MQPVKTDQSNVTLTLPDGTEANDLPAERVQMKSADGGQWPGFESVWLANEAEREALAAGVPVVVRIWGERHPPISLAVPDAPIEHRAIDADHAARALGRLYALMAGTNAMSLTVIDDVGGEQTIDATAFLELWTQAVRDTISSPACPACGAPPDEPCAETCEANR